jgi:hypothetical protein
MGDAIQRRYPRLIHCMRSAGHVSESEAIGALVEYKIFGIREGFGSEAIAHLGGQLEAIRHGIKCRHFTSSTL